MSGRVLVLGPAVAADPVARACGATAAADIFEALGAVTVAGPRSTFDLVILEDGDEPASARRDAEALRRVDPSLPIALAVPAGRNGVTPEGFDAVLELPLEPRRLAVLLGEDEGAEAPEPSAPTTPAPAESAPTESAPTESAPTAEDEGPAAAPARRADDEAPAAGDERGAEAADDHVAKEAERRATRKRPAPPPPAVIVDRPAELGDVDLVDKLLEEQGGLLETALAIVEQHAGIGDLRLASEPPPGGATTAVEVAHGDVAFGWLCSDRAPQRQLRPWAGWLARWLALEARLRGHWLLAHRDDLTGAWNRRFFNRFIDDSIRRARERRRPISVMVFDIDDFKKYNDEYGHHAGDVVLVETVRLLQSVIRRGDRVCRIGGDEFAVVFADLEGPREAGSTHPATPELIAARFQDQICRMRFPKLGAEAPGPLSVSAGLASFPWDGTTARELLECADARALQSKRKGKNALTMGPDAARRDR